MSTGRLQRCLAVVRMSANPWVVAGMALVLAKLALVSGRLCLALGNAGRDDALFVDLAHNISEGIWLGRYNALTLVKGPMYPLWIAALHRLDVPLFFGQHLLYTFACVLVIRALRPLRLHPAALLLVFALLLFNPMTWSVIALRVVRIGIYPALTLIVVGTSIGVHTYRDGPLRNLVVWSASLGVSMAAFWLTREEGVWILPTVLLIFGSSILGVWRSGLVDRSRRLGLASAWIPVFLLLVGAVCLLNQYRYGVFATTEMKRGEYAAAYGALTRVASGESIRFVPVSRSTRSQVYRVSPAFRELKPYLEGGIGQFFTSSGGAGKIPAGEMGGGRFMFAFRSAVEAAGYYDSGEHAMGYYDRLAREVNEACEQSRLECLSSRVTLRPVWRSGDELVLAEAVFRAIWFLVSFDHFSVREPEASGSDWQLQRFTKMTGEPVATGEALRLREREYARHPPLSHRARQIVGKAYQRVFRWLFVVSVGLWVWAWFQAWRRRSIDSAMILTTALAGAVLARAILLSWMQIATYQHSIDSLYFSSAYPLALLFFAVSTASHFGGLSRFRSRSSWRTR